METIGIRRYKPLGENRVYIGNYHTVICASPMYLNFGENGGAL